MYEEKGAKAKEKRTLYAHSRTYMTALVALDYQKRLIHTHSHVNTHMHTCICTYTFEENITTTT